MKRECQCPRVTHQHGTSQAYLIDKCRCVECCEARSQYKQQWNRTVAHSKFGVGVPHGIVSACGVERRLQALSAIGWSSKEMGRRLGVTMQAVNNLRDGRFRTRGARAATTERIVALYEDLWNVHPTGSGPTRARAHARKHDWAVPAAWDDDEIDDPNAKPYRAKTCACGQQFGGARSQCLACRRAAAWNAKGPALLAGLLAV